MTWIKGKHTVKSGGSITLRSREILNADTIAGVFNFNNNMTSNCAGQPAGCSVNSATGFDVASFMLGLREHQEPQLFDENTYTEKRPEYTLYVQDDFRVTQPPDDEPRAAVGRVSALDRDRRPAVELRRGDGQVRGRV